MNHVASRSLDDSAKERQAKALLERMACADQKALAALNALMRRRIYAFALNRLHDPAEAESVVNETLWEAWKQPRAFDGTSKVSTWMLGIARFKVLATLRGRHDAEILDETLESTIECPNPGPFDRVLEQEEAVRLRAGMARLSAEHRAVLDALYFQDLSVDEIAVAHGCPKGTVQTRLFHARAQLRRQLGAFTRSWRPTGFAEA